MITIKESSDKKIFLHLREWTNKNIKTYGCENLYCNNKINSLFEIANNNEMFVGGYCKDCVEYFLDRIDKYPQGLFHELFINHLSIIEGVPNSKHSENPTVANEDVPGEPHGESLLNHEVFTWGIMSESNRILRSSRQMGTITRAISEQAFRGAVRDQVRAHQRNSPIRFRAIGNMPEESNSQSLRYIS